MMFLRAGFNPKHRLVCYAMIARRDRRWVRPARLVRFACGDYAWAGVRGGVSWPKQVIIFSFVLPADLAQSRIELAKCELYDQVYQGERFREAIERYKVSCA